MYKKFLELGNGNAVEINTEMKFNNWFKIDPNVKEITEGEYYLKTKSEQNLKDAAKIIVESFMAKAETYVLDNMDKVSVVDITKYTVNGKLDVDTIKQSISQHQVKAASMLLLLNIYNRWIGIIKDAAEDNTKVNELDKLPSVIPSELLTYVNNLWKVQKAGEVKKLIDLGAIQSNLIPNMEYFTQAAVISDESEKSIE